jgi:triphosphoribosyl-dephospho-CoA synthase
VKSDFGFVCLLFFVPWCLGGLFLSNFRAIVVGGMVSSARWTAQLAEWIRLACRVEAFCAKAGNVHRRASFADLTHADFVRAADLVAEPLAHAASLGVGRAVLDAVSATRAALGTNPNLGIVLLIAPLAAVPEGVRLVEGIESVLAGLTVGDAERVYEAIRVANPGGLGTASEQDVAQAPTETLRQVMCRAAGRDRVAAEYCTGFREVFDHVLPGLAAVTDFRRDFETSVRREQLKLLAREPDSLVARKCGGEVAAEVSRRAADVLNSGWPETEVTWREFDGWLRADGNRRNPGTVADLIAAGLFAGFREGVLPAVELDE